MTDIIAVCRAEGGDVDFREWRRRRQPVEKELSIRVLRIGRGPVETSRNWPGGRSSVNKRSSNKFSGGIGSVDGSKEMDIDEMVDKVRTYAEGAAS